MEKVSDFKRKILFMDYPGEVGASNYVSFTCDIIKQYKDFFRSDVGGCWDENEFVDINLTNPYALNEKKCSEALEEIKNCDYSIVVFVGHGCNYDGLDMIQLNSNEKLFPVEQLYTNAKKRLVIIDSCRTYLGQLSVPSLSFMISESEDSRRERNRESYNKIIRDIPNHIELIQSTQKGRKARTLSSEKSSVFSRAFLEIIKSLASSRPAKCRRLMKINDPYSVSYNGIKAEVDNAIANNNQQSDYNCFIGNIEYRPENGEKGYFPLLCIDNNNNLL